MAGIMPAMVLGAAPGFRKATLELAREVERRGFSAIVCPSFGDNVGLAEAVVLSTSRITVATGIANLYLRHPADYANTAALLHELSDGRFVLGVGVSHNTHNQNGRYGIQGGRPLADVRAWVERYRAALGTRPAAPLVLATLRRRMTELAVELADGILLANACLSHVPDTLAAVPAARRERFFIGNMTPICVGDDRAATSAALRRHLAAYMAMPNYQNYWIEAGYADDVAAARTALARGDHGGMAAAISERLIEDTSIRGTPAQCREGFARFLAAGITTVALMPIAASGGPKQSRSPLPDSIAGGRLDDFLPVMDTFSAMRV